MSASVTSKGRKKNLKALMNYAVEAQKTTFKDTVLITGIKCSDNPKEAVKEMNFIRKHLNKVKNEKTQAYHVVHSFSKETTDKFSPSFLHELSVEFAEKSFPYCQITVASHLNTEYLHSHIIINNINISSGKRIRIDPKNLENMRMINDDILEHNNIEPIDNEYYENLDKKNNLYFRNPKRLKTGVQNDQLTIQEAVYSVLKNKNVTDFKMFSNSLAKNYNIEVYRHSKDSDKLGYNVYKDDINFYSNQEYYTKLGETKESRKEKTKYVSRNFSARKLGRDFSFDRIKQKLKENEVNQLDIKKEKELERQQKLKYKEIIPINDVNESSQELKRVLENDVNMYRAKKDYEFLQRKIEYERQRRSTLER